MFKPLHKISLWIDFVIVNLAMSIFEIFKIKILYMPSVTRIGHLASDPDTFIKQNSIENKKYNIVIMLVDQEICNQYLLRLWKQKFFIIKISKKTKKRIIHRINKYNLKQIEWLYYPIKPKYKILSEYNGTDTIVIPKKDIELGKKILLEMGLKKDDKIVCLHNREGGYLPELTYHSHRDADISNYTLAIKFLIEKGYKVIRIGDKSMKKVNLSDEANFIDYPFSKWKSDFMDVFLLNCCDLALMTTSGPIALARLFKKPVCMVNVASILNIPICVGEIFIMKLIINKKKNKLLTLTEILNLGLITHAEQYSELGLEVIENNSLDIKNAVEEMLGLLNNKIKLTELQDKFDKIFSKEGIELNTKARIGNKFAEEYSYIIN